MSNEERLKVLEYLKNCYHNLDIGKKKKMREDLKNRCHSIKVN